jgi:hypothetical protein
MKELPEAGLVRKTITLREMDLPPEVKLTKKSLLRWFALSTGLITEKESRTTGLDVLDALFFLQLSKNKKPSTLEIQQLIKSKRGREVSEKLIRYHLKRLIDLGFLRRKKNKYLFNNAPEGDHTDLKSAYNHWVSQNVAKSLQNTEKVLDQLAKKYK